MTLEPAMPPQHAAFLQVALPLLQGDPRIAGVAGAGSLVTGGMDEYSDIDLVIAVQPEAFEGVLAERMEIAGRLGPLLVGFTGEHVGEPRLLICLYGPPLLHVDLKFVALPDLARRVEDPQVLWERDGLLTSAFAAGKPHFPQPDLQWIEDRFWVWIHYGAGKVGRGELFEALDFLAYLRGQALGPLLLLKHGRLPRGVRRIETDAAGDLPALLQTLGGHDAAEVARALERSAKLYRALRDAHPARETLTPRADAEAHALAYLREIRARVQPALRGEPEHAPPDETAVRAQVGRAWERDGESGAGSAHPPADTAPTPAR